MATLQELKRENERLKNRMKSREEIHKIGIERDKLRRENKELRRPVLTKVKIASGKFLVGVGNKSAKFLKNSVTPTKQKKTKTTSKKTKYKPLNMGDLL